MLTEFTPKTVDLTEEEYRILLREFKNKVVVYRSEEKDKFDLYPQQYVGIVVLPTHPIIIQPKIPLLNFFYMLVYSYNIPEFAKQLFSFRPEHDIYEIIVSKFVQEIEKLVEMGMYKNYLTVEDNLSAVKGRIIVNINERLNMVQRQKIYCKFSDFTSDILENRILKYTLYKLSFLCFRDYSLKSRIRKLLHYFDSVSFEFIRDAHFDAAEANLTRLNEHYRPLIRISRILIENISLNLQKHGRVGFWSFLIDMNHLFQKFVTFCLQDLKGFEVKSEPVYPWDIECLTTIKPDIVIRQGKDVKLVLDAKYKLISLDKKEVYGDDVRQVGDYCTTLGLQKGILVYPRISIEQKVSDFLIKKKDPVTGRIYQIILKTIDLTSTDLPVFQSACKDFVVSIESILNSQ